MRWWCLWLAACSAAPVGQRQLTNSAGPTASNLTEWNWNRQLVVDDTGTVHVAWARLGTTNVDQPADRPDPVDPSTLPMGQIFYKKSTDGGQTWTADQALTTVAAGTDSASLAIWNGEVYVLYRAADSGRLRVFVSKSGAAGVPISDNPAGVSISPPAIAAGNLLAVVWADGRYGTKEVMLSTSSDGTSWSAATPVSVPDGFSSWTPAVAVLDDVIHVAWTDERDDTAECTLGANSCHEEEYYRRSPDGGATWGPETRLTFDPHES